MLGKAWTPETPPAFLSCLLGFVWLLLFFFWLHWLFVEACGLSLVVAHRDFSLVLAHQLQNVKLSCSAACGILVPKPRIEPASPALEGGSLTTGPPGKSHVPFVLLTIVGGGRCPVHLSKWYPPLDPLGKGKGAKVSRSKTRVLGLESPPHHLGQLALTLTSLFAPAVDHGPFSGRTSQRCSKDSVGAVCDQAVPGRPLPLPEMSVHHCPTSLLTADPGVRLL